MPQGICDRNNGTCACRRGFSGAACDISEYFQYIPNMQFAYFVSQCCAQPVLHRAHLDCHERYQIWMVFIRRAVEKGDVCLYEKSARQTTSSPFWTTLNTQVGTWI